MNHDENRVFDEAKKSRYRELARRLSAAYVSNQLGMVGVDHTLKKHVHEPGELWYFFAEAITNAICESQNQQFEEKTKGPAIN